MSKVPDNPGMPMLPEKAVDPLPGDFANDNQCATRPLGFAAPTQLDGEDDYFEEEHANTMSASSCKKLASEGSQEGPPVTPARRNTTVAVPAPYVSPKTPARLKAPDNRRRSSGVGISQQPKENVGTVKLLEKIIDHHESKLFGKSSLAKENLAAIKLARPLRRFVQKRPASDADIERPKKMQELEAKAQGGKIEQENTPANEEQMVAVNPVEEVTKSKACVVKEPPSKSVRFRPLQKPPSKRKQSTGLALFQIPLAEYAKSCSKQQDAVASDKQTRPKRMRFQPLEAWRNERVLFERPPGSMVPVVQGVMLNCGPRSGISPPRRLSVHVKACMLEAISVEMLEAAHSIEFPGTVEEAVTSRILAFPAWETGPRPHTVRLPEVASGLLHVLSGRIRMAFEGVSGQGEDETILGQGDFRSLRADLRAILVAVAGLPGQSAPASIRCVMVRNPPGQPVAAALTDGYK